MSLLCCAVAAEVTLETARVNRGVGGSKRIKSVWPESAVTEMISGLGTLEVSGVLQCYLACCHGLRRSEV